MQKEYHDRGYQNTIIFDLNKNILITGLPGCGKTSLIEKLSVGRKVGGIITPEVRRQDSRWGFEIVDLKTHKKGILASVEVKEGPRVGKYKVNLSDLEEIGANAIKNAIDDSEVELIVIDEIGKMECCSEEFKKVVLEALNSKKPVLAVILLKTTVSFINQIKTRNDVKIFHLQKSNFEQVFEEIKEILENF